MKTFYVKRHGKLFGPLSATQVASCLSKDIFTQADHISPDRVNWQKMTSFVADEESAPPPADFAAQPGELALPAQPPANTPGALTMRPQLLPMTPGVQPSAPGPLLAPPVAKSPSDATFAAFWKNYAVFKGRATRSEYWWPLFINVLIVAPLSFCGGIFQGSDDLQVLANIAIGLAALYVLAVAIPSWSVSVRRLHDLNYSGWLLLVTFIPFLGWFFNIIILLLFFFEGTKGPNKYGADPNASRLT